MKSKIKLAYAIAAVVAVAAVAVPAAPAQDQPPPLKPPEGVEPGLANQWPKPSAKGKFDIAFYVETVTASPGESVFGKAAPTRCTQTNFFARGERVVWHISAINARTGTLIQGSDVKYAYLKIPGMKNVAVTYIPHGRDPATATWSWTARWDVPLDYPLGVVPFQLVMKLKDWKANHIAKWTQFPIPLEQLTIIDHR